MQFGITWTRGVEVPHRPSRLIAPPASSSEPDRLVRSPYRRAGGDPPTCDILSFRSVKWSKRHSNQRCSSARYLFDAAVEMAEQHACCAVPDVKL
ncbi:MULTISPECIES: hypothetical protein [Nocardia]|uniref:hypothetical protein n=1 Tax=Nocardia TaxID=1817 RepID=UPI0018955974|nr:MULTISPECIES: hypothetical protein [Nocardia]MBF6350023.1 hypothetical protein [Nocardia flavorosea]